MARPRAEARARAFVHALAEETADLAPGTWRMLDTIARRMGIGFDQAEEIAKHCMQRRWLEYDAYSVRLEEDGREVARSIRKRLRPS